MGISTQGVPLLTEQVLNKAIEANIVRQFCPGSGNRILIPEFQRIFPLIPGFSLTPVLQCHKQGKVRQPTTVFAAEIVKIVRTRKSVICQVQHLQAALILGAKVYFGSIFPPEKALYFFPAKQPIPDQLFEIDEVMVTCISRTRLIGRISITRGGQGQDLPIALTRLFQKIDKRKRLCAHGADSISTGQRGDVHQNTARTHNDHSFE